MAETQPKPESLKRYSRVVFICPKANGQHLVFMQKTNKNFLLFPGGCVEGNEDLLDTLKRELEEETVAHRSVIKYLIGEIMYCSQHFSQYTKHFIESYFVLAGMDENLIKQIYTHNSQEKEIQWSGWLTLKEALSNDNQIGHLYPNVRASLEHINNNIGTYLQPSFYLTTNAANETRFELPY